METTKETLGRLARALRSEADDVAARQVDKHGSLKDPVVTDRDYQRGAHDAYRRAADLLDEGKGA